MSWFNFWKKKADQFKDEKPEKVEVVEIKNPEPAPPEPEPQIFTLRAEIAILDDRQLATNRSYRKGAKLESINPVPVYCGERIIGGANVFIQNDVLMCDMFLDYNIPERLDYENNTKDSYVHYQGFQRVEDTVDFPKIIAYCIHAVEIRKKPNADPRIRPI